MKKASLEDWENIGAQSKAVQNELIKLVTLSSGKLPVALVNQVTKSIRQLADFKCRAEDRMLKSGVTDDLNIFYGGEK